MKVMIRLFLLFALALGWSGAYAADTEFKEGTQYQRVPADIMKNELIRDFAKKANGKVQVLEFFSYGCHWCYKLDPAIDSWRKNLLPSVDFQRVPVEFQSAWNTLGKAYYTALNLNILDKIHGPLFEAVQTEKMPTTTIDALRQFFVDRGVTAVEFNQMFTSFDVTRQQKWATAITRAYQINAVPQVVVQGKAGTFVTSVRQAGSEEALIDVINHLIKLENSYGMSASRVSSTQ